MNTKECEYKEVRVKVKQSQCDVNDSILYGQVSIFVDLRSKYRPQTVASFNIEFSFSFKKSRSRKSTKDGQ
jgi:hypothetical protein